MSKLKSLAERARRPLAVFMTATLALSSVPASPIAQAVAAYAEESGGQEATGSGSYANTQTWDLSGDAPVVTYDVHPSSGDGAGVLKVSKSAIKEYLKAADAVTTAESSYIASSAFATKQAGELSDAESTINEGLAAKDGDDIDSFYRVESGTAAQSGDVSHKVSDLEFKAVGSAIAGVTVDDTSDDNYVLVKVDKKAAAADVENVTLSFAVTSITSSYSYDYTYTLKPTSKAATSGSDAYYTGDKATKTISGKTSKDNSATVSPSNLSAVIKLDADSNSKTYTKDEFDALVKASSGVSDAVNAVSWDDVKSSAESACSEIAGDITVPDELSSSKADNEYFYKYDADNGSSVTPVEKVKNVSLSGVSYTAPEAAEGSPSITIASDGSVTISVDAGEKLAGKSVSIPVANLDVSYDFDYSYTLVVDASRVGGYYTIQAGVAGESAIKGTCGDVVVPNENISLNKNASFKSYWDDLDAEAIATPVTYANSEDALVYRGVKQMQELFKTLEGLVGTIVQSDLDAVSPYFVPTVKAESGAYSVELDPKGATSTARDFTISWAYPDGVAAGTTKVTVSSVATYVIDLSECTVTLPFRLADSQKQLDALEKGINDYVAGETTNNGAVEVLTYASNAKIIDEQTYYGAELADVSLAGDDFSYVAQPVDKNAYLANYTIEGVPQVTIQAMEKVAWADGNVRLTKKGLSDDNAITASNWEDVTSWTREIPAASWDGYKLAYGAAAAKDGSYEGSATLSGGDGKHKNISLYAMSGDEIISQVTGISYMLDRQAPVITGASVSSSESASFGGIFFGNRTVHVDVTLADALSSTGETTADTLETITSGLNSVSATYDDTENGRSGIDSGISGDLSTGIYAFDITGDAEVAKDNIHVTAVDNAGNVMESDANENKGIPIEYTKLVADASAPTVSASWSNNDVKNGKYYNADRTLTVEVDDAFFNYIVDYANDQVMFTVSQNGEVVMAIHPSDFSETSANHWVYSLPFTSDADWVVSEIGVTDIIGRRSNTVAGDDFVIDKTAPTMQVTFDNNDVRNGMYYNATRTATISITEHNFSADLVKVTPTSSDVNGEACTAASVSGWSGSGDVHTATVYFAGPGSYTLSVDGQDLATNALTPYTCSEFIVDTTKPEIHIDNVENLTAYGPDEVIAPAASIHDTNLDVSSTIQVTKISYPLSPDDENPYSTAPGSTATDMTVAYSNPEATKAHDGVYTILVEAVDLAGNTESQAVTWSVNRFGSTYVISDVTGEMVNHYLRSADLVDVTVTEINPSGLDETQTAVELTRDTQNTTLVNNEHYTVGESTSTGWHEYTYTVNKTNYEKKDGTYRVLFHSQDTAGNSSENTMVGKNAEVEDSAAEVNFAVDDTKPIASFVDLTSGGRYEEAGHTAKVTFEDNLKLDHAVIKVNGQTYAELDADQLEASATHEIKLAESNELQKVTVAVYDAAGNASDELVADKLLVTTDPITLWTTNTPLLIGSIVGIAAVAGGLIWFILGRRKKDEEVA